MSQSKKEFINSKLSKEEQYKQMKFINRVHTETWFDESGT